MLYILTKYHYWILKHPTPLFPTNRHWASFNEKSDLCVEIKFSRFYFHQNDLRIKCNPLAPRRVINPAWNMDLMGGKSLQITFFKLLNYKSRDIQIDFLSHFYSLGSLNIFSENYSNAAIIYCCGPILLLASEMIETSWTKTKIVCDKPKAVFSHLPTIREISI